MITKRKGVHFKSISVFPISLPKSWCSLKKKGFHIKSISVFPISLPKSWCSLKKKVFTSNPSRFSQFFSRKHGVLSKKKVLTSMKRAVACGNFETSHAIGMPKPGHKIGFIQDQFSS